MTPLVDVIVIGAGPAGVAAAITLARAGKKVVVVERGHFAGSKNVFGGAIYTRHTSEIYPEFWKVAPLERPITENRYYILGETDGTSVSYRSPVEDGVANAYSVVRAKWDRWCAEQAEKEGVCFAFQTPVRDVIFEGQRVVGIRTDNEDFYAPVTIIADGANSLLVEKAGLRKQIDSADVAVSVKEVIRLSKDQINERFSLDETSGVCAEYIGGPMYGMLGLGFCYTNTETVTIGAGISLKELQRTGLKPYDILEKMKKHPMLSPLIKDGTMLEYSAHLIPEGGYKKIPRLYAAGVLVAGDAAMLVNSVHMEGTNLAMISGKFAAQAAIAAIEQGDFSAKSLSLYQKLLADSFVLKDLKTYQNIMEFALDNSQAFLDFYPKKVNQFMNAFVTADGQPKSQKFRNFILKVFKQRNFLLVISDILKGVKQVGEILLK